MKNPILIFLLLFTHVFYSYGGTPWDGTVATAFASGDGTSTDPYQIKTAEQFAYFAWYQSYIGKYFELIDDIDLNNQLFTPVGYSDPFDGNFDGKNHRIKNLKIIETGTNIAVGLFATTAPKGTIKNLIIESGIIETQNLKDCGSFVGYNQGVVENCHNYATVKATNFSGTIENGIGGIAGRNVGAASSGTIFNCVNFGNVINESSVTLFYTGGIVGYDDNQTPTATEFRVIARCMNFGNVSSVISHTGGIIGKSRVPSYIIGLANFGDVSSTAQTLMGETSKSEIGGIVGRNYEHLQHCLNMGNIIKPAATNAVASGGISGELNATSGSSVTIQFCYNRGTADFGIAPASLTPKNFTNVFYDNEITQNGYGAEAVTGIENKSSTEMKTKAFLDLLNDTQDPNSKPWIFCTQLNDGYPVMNFMVKKVTFINSSLGIIVKTYGKTVATVTDSVWLGSKVEFSLAAGYQWQSGGTDPKIMYAADDITFTEKAVATTAISYTIKATSNLTASTISIKGFVDNIEKTNWTTGEIVPTGSTVLLQATSSNEKYVFVAWKEGETTVSTVAQYTFTVSANKDLVAEFKERYHINIISSVGGTVTKDYSGDWVDAGTTVNLTITPNEGSQIKKVTLKNIGEETDIAFTLTGYILILSNISSDSEVTVTFEAKEPTGISDNMIQQPIVYSRNHQIFVETFAPATVIGYNIMGQITFESYQEENALACYDVLVTGLYFVKIGQPQRSIVKKVMVQ